MNSNIARRIARMNWGEVNYSYKTNRKGAYYFSCSGHGGYVVFDFALTDKEKEKLKITSEKGSDIALLFIDDGEIAQANIDKCRTEEDKNHKNMKYYTYEEDNRRALLEYHTGIRHEGTADKEQHNNRICLGMERDFPEMINEEDKEKFKEMRKAKDEEYKKIYEEKNLILNQKQGK